MRKTLPQTLLAAFCAILAHLPVEGGGVMLVGARTAAWAKAGGSWPVPQYVGVNLVGSSVQNNDGILSGFTSSSYATLPFYFAAGATSLEAVCKFHHIGSSSRQGIWGCVGSINSFTPLYCDNGVCGTYVSSNSSSWNVSVPKDNHFDIDITITGDYLVCIRFDTNKYFLERFSSEWITDKTFTGAAPYGSSSVIMQFGTNRGASYPMFGTIDLNYTYLMRDGELLWEGAAGAYRNVALLTT